MTRGLALLAPPLCCDPDVHRLYTMAATLAEFARVVTPDAIDTARDLDALHRAVEDAFLGVHQDSRDATLSAYTPLSRGGEDLARGTERLLDAWHEVYVGIAALERGPVAVREVPAVAGPHHVDACGQAVSP